jgi:hypothetical protein
VFAVAALTFASGGVVAARMRETHHGGTVGEVVAPPL